MNANAKGREGRAARPNRLGGLLCFLIKAPLPSAGEARVGAGVCLPFFVQ